MTNPNFPTQAREIIDGQHTVARSDGNGGWIKVEALAALWLKLQEAPNGK